MKDLGEERGDCLQIIGADPARGGRLEGQNLVQQVEQAYAQDDPQQPEPRLLRG